MKEYDTKKKAEKLAYQVDLGVIAEFMLGELIRLDISIPEFAREEVLKTTREILRK